MRLASIYATDSRRTKAVHLAGPGPYSSLADEFRRLARTAAPAEDALPVLLLVDLSAGAVLSKRRARHAAEPVEPEPEPVEQEPEPVSKPPRSRRNPGDGQ